jgi:CHRD domain
MKRFAACGLLLATAILIGSANFAAAQHAGMGTAMATNTLLVAQLDAKQVAGGSSSSATGTGAFLLDPVQHTLEYNLTYQGLEAGGPKSIALYNFDKGKNGDVVKVLCGADAQPCPNGTSATISGRFERGDKRALDNDLIGEFDSGRVYVEIVGGDGKPEIRGQLGFNGAMVMVANYVANLGPAAGTNSKGTGTAILSETHLPGGKISVFYTATVAGTSGEPTNAALVNGPTPKTLAFTPRAALPKLQPRLSRDTKTGGSFTGSYEVNSTAPNALFATRLLKTGKGETGIVVTTSRFPGGELYGALVPVR